MAGASPQRDWLHLWCHEGHDWITVGGRACAEHEEGRPCASWYPSQPAFVCARCDAIDYGEVGGPGWEACQDCARRAS